MAGKCKFQVSRLLDDKLKRLCECPEEVCQDVSQLDRAFILGFNYGNVTNYVGLTTDYKLHDSSLAVVGLHFQSEPPSEDDIRTTLISIQEHYRAAVGDHSKSDKNDSVYMIHYRDETTKQSTRKLYNLAQGNYFAEQPAIVVLEEAKIHMHSTLAKLNATLGLKIFENDSNKLAAEEKISEIIDEAKRRLSAGLSLHLVGSNFSSKTPQENKSTLETLYSNLDVPKEVECMGDYLPQMSKEEKKALQTKWRNRVKDQRAPFEFQLECENLITNDAGDSAGTYNLKLEEYLYLQVNDSIAKCTKRILNLLAQKLDLLKVALASGQCQADNCLEPDEVQSCAFKPHNVGHLIQAVYLIPTKRVPLYEQLRRAREQLHKAYLLATDGPVVRHSQRLQNVDLKNQDQLGGFLCNVHQSLADKSGIKGASMHQTVTGTYTYHHYLQNRVADSGWVCAYRSLHTIISWFKHQAYIYSPDVEPKQRLADKTEPLRRKLGQEKRVPTHEEIQQVLVDIGDKQASFVGSQKWIGSQEVCFVLDHLYKIESKFISVSSGSELVYKARELAQHFAGQSTPVMIGGGVLAHTIIGLDFNEKSGDVGYLILDPHYTGAEDLNAITKKGWCGWKKNSFWDKGAFYNLCLPQRPAEI